MSDFKELLTLLEKFRDDRDWGQFHDSKNLALALSIEAAELNELFLWKKESDSEEVDRQRLREELADVFAYAIMLAGRHGLDVSEIVKEKIEKSKRPLLIFPQGTRVKLDEQPPFKKGVGRIYKALNLPCIPVALNTGQVWPKNSFMKFSGDIHISFLDPIMPGKDNDEFTKELENKIYNEIKKYY